MTVRADVKKMVVSLPRKGVQTFSQCVVWLWQKVNCRSGQPVSELIPDWSVVSYSGQTTWVHSVFSVHVDVRKPISE